MIGPIHHIELWVADLPAALESFGWLLPELGWSTENSWPGGHSWRLGDTYLVTTTTPTLTSSEHQRRAPGLNHLALHAGPASNVDRLMKLAVDHGWSPLYSDRYPHAGGPDHYAGYLENASGFKIELVAEES
ncbi:VOC family protein [Leifsonia aquatica]|uniref:VOC family protein n=1 Tax=Leifsonia aquatica TaxID=144185 RepID=UPI00384EB3F8